MQKRKSARRIIGVLLIAGLAGLAACRGSGSGEEAYNWVTIDDAYVPQDDVETFIKTDAQNRGALPVFIRNYGSDKRILGVFKGRQYVTPSPNALTMLNPGLDDWKIVDIRYTTESEREIVRTVLYFKVKGVWKVGDSGTLVSP
jgi:hypothetical protein